MAVLNSIAKFLKFIFSKTHWNKTIFLLLLIIIGILLTVKDCNIDACGVRVNTDTKYPKLKSGSDERPPAQR